MLSKEIRTDEIDFAAYLLLQDARLVSAEPKDARFVQFVFEAQSTDHAWALTTTYNQGSVYVPARAYGKAVNRIKALIKSVKSQRQ